MKRFFTLIAAVAMAASVNAQGTYVVKEGDKYTVRFEIKSVDNIKAYYMENEGATFKDGKKQANWADADFEAYVSSSTNGSKFTEGEEPTGAYLKFEPIKTGTVEVGIQIDKNKGLCLVGSDLKKSMDYTYNLPAAKDGESQTLTTTEDGKQVVASKANGTVTFKVEGGKKYYLMALGSKIGFFGFKYTVGGTPGISTVATTSSAKSSATYNLAGQQVSDSYKGLVVKNGKKYMK